MSSETMPYQLTRDLVIRAPRDRVFAYFTDTPRWAAWWGAGSTIDPSPGGAVLIKHPNGIEVVGEVIDIDPPSRIVFTYGFASGAPIPPGGSLVTVTCAPHPQGTRVELVHDFAEQGVRDAHDQGWRYQLSVFANVVSDAVHADVATVVDAWHTLWGEANAEARARQLDAIAAPSIRFEDRFSAVAGAGDLLPHIAATQRFMPGLRLVRDGDVRHCQGMAVADWVARTADGQERGRGTNVYTLGHDGRLLAVTGFWRATAS